MKKRIAIVLAVLSIFTVLASCNRRDQYRDPVGTETNAGTTTPTTNAVTDQPDNPDETTGLDTESGTKPANPGNSPSPEGKGNPYAGMSKDDLLALYQQTPERATYSSDLAYNTPYYYVIRSDTFQPGGRAYSKLTGKYVTLCKELGLSFIELNMNFPEYQIDKMEDVEFFYKSADETGIYYTIHLDENLNVAEFNPLVREAYLETVKRTIDVAKSFLKLRDKYGDIKQPLTINMHMNHGIFITLPDKKVQMYERDFDTYIEYIKKYVCAGSEKAPNQLECFYFEKNV